MIGCIPLNLEVQWASCTKDCPVFSPDAKWIQPEAGEMSVCDRSIFLFPTWFSPGHGILSRNTQLFLLIHRYSSLAIRSLRKLSNEPFKVTMTSEIVHISLGIFRNCLNQPVRNEIRKNFTEHLKERLLMEANGSWRILNWIFPGLSTTLVLEIPFKVSHGCFAKLKNASPREFTRDLSIRCSPDGL